jgi:curved DNA-binding protein CbpA
MIFPTRQPRHVAEGVVNLAKSVVTGVGMGVLSMLAMPVAGFREGGWAGLIAGSLAGTLYGAIFAMVGLANGAYQMARGAIETPNAFRAAQQGMVWDKAREEWKRYYLEEELDELTSYSPYQDASRSVKDATYYKLLDVATIADPKEIKRAYYRKARDVHPDKNPNNAAAAESFRKLHTAYLTLSDEEKRAAYDKWGMSEKNEDASSLIPEFDPYVFYAVLFSSQLVEPYIGELTVASFTDQVLQLLRSGGHSAEDYVKLLWGGSDHRPRKRQLEIAIHLKGRVGGYVNGTESKAEFRTKCRQEASAIADSPFGNEYLTAIGSALIMESSQFLGFQRSVVGWFSGAAFLMKKNVNKLKSMVTIVRETIDVLKLLPRESYGDDGELKGKKSDEERMEELLPELLDVAWAYNFQDISKTLHGACSRLFADASANSRYKRLERAEAVQMLGEEFLLMATRDIDGKQAGNGTPPKNLMARLEVAFQVSVMKVNCYFEGGIRQYNEIKGLLTCFSLFSRLLDRKHLKIQKQ